MLTVIRENRERVLLSLVFCLYFGLSVVAAVEYAVR